MATETDALDVLDDRSAIDRIDKSGLLARIDALPEQCEEAWDRARAFDWPEHAAAASNVVVLGMGGSAIAGDILCSLAGTSGSKPAASVRGYSVPMFVGPDTFVVACSHSGNTEETVSALDAALARGARGAVITTGGRLAEIAQARELPAFVYQYDGQPRCALGHQLMALLALGEQAGLLRDQEVAVQVALSAMRSFRAEVAAQVPVRSNPAKLIAGRLHGRVPVIVGSGALADAAHRWKTQVNENAKSWAFWDELPEIDHNSVVGFGLPQAVTAQLRVLFLLPQPIERRSEVRYEATAAELTRAGVAHERIDIRAEDALSLVLSAIYLGDFASCYLALLNGVDPTPIDPITRVKQRLAEG